MTVPLVLFWIWLFIKICQASEYEQKRRRAFKRRTGRWPVFGRDDW
jgi:hypothetical protein